MATTARFASFGPFFRNGAVLTDANVYHYFAGTTTDKAAYTDYNKTTTADQPLVTDETGTAWGYFDGLYKIIVTDSEGSLLYSWDNWGIVLSSVIDIRTTAQLDQPSTSMDGQFVIEQDAVGNFNLVIYAGGERHRIASGSNF